MGIARSTVYAVLRRVGLHRLAWLHRTTREIVRYEHVPLVGMPEPTARLAGAPEGGGNGLQDVGCKGLHGVAWGCKRFASDLLNLTLASPAVNRSQKSGKDAAEWLPDLNHCWFANRVVEVHQRYDLTVDRRERDVLEGILSGCTSTEMVVRQGRPVQTATPVPATGGGETGSALQRYDDNGNGRITCAEARRHGIAPVPRGTSRVPIHGRQGQRRGGV